MRIALSLVRSRFRLLARTTAVLDKSGTRIFADLKTPLGLQLYRYGFCDPGACFVRSRLRSGDAFVDGGANIGLFTLIAAAQVGERGRVVACEPSPKTIALLRANLSLNRFDWVDPLEVALGEGSGRMTFASFEPGSGLSSFAPADETGAQRHGVSVVTLDEVASDLPRLRLIKLDVEGAEARAMRGATHLLEAVRPVFLIEVEPDHLARQGSNVKELEQIFCDADYVACALVRTGDGVELALLEGSWDSSAWPDPNVVLRPRELEVL